MLARCRVLFDEVVDVPVVLCNGVLRVQKTVEVIQLAPQMRVEERITVQVVDIPLPHIMDEMIVVSCVAVLVLTSGGMLSTWHRLCVLRPSVPKCPPAQS